MPVFTIEAPTGAGRDAKQKMLKEIHDALDEATTSPTPGDGCANSDKNVAQDGRVQAEPVRPVARWRCRSSSAWKPTANW